MFKKIVSIVIALLMISFGVRLIDTVKDHFKPINQSFVVVDKLESVLHGKRSATNRYTLVLKRDDGLMTDLTVRPYVWSQAKVDDKLVFSLAPNELDHDPNKVMIMLTGIFFIIFGMCFVIFKF